LLEAARRLQVSKTRTLLPAVCCGAVRTVLVGGKRKVPEDELRRVAVEGLAPPRRGFVPEHEQRVAGPATSKPRVALVRALRVPDGA